MSDKKNLPAPIDFNEVIENATELFKTQATLGSDDDADLEKVELVKAKANAALDAISNALEMSQLLELVKSKDHEFKRQIELEAMNPMLRSFKAIAVANEKAINRILLELDKLSEQPELNIDKMDYLNVMLNSCLEKSVKSASGLSTLIKLQKDTARLGQGSRKATPSSISFIKGVGTDGDDGKEKVRKLTMDDLKKIAEGKD